MSVLESVIANGQSMNLPQLLLAFVACAGYALAQGALLNDPGRRIAWLVCVLAALGFTLESPAWMAAVVLLAFAIAGLGAFVIAVWLISGCSAWLGQPHRLGLPAIPEMP